MGRAFRQALMRASMNRPSRNLHALPEDSFVRESDAGLNIERARREHDHVEFFKDTCAGPTLGQVRLNLLPIHSSERAVMKITEQRDALCAIH